MLSERPQRQSNAGVVHIARKNLMFEVRSALRRTERSSFFCIEGVKTTSHVSRSAALLGHSDYQANELHHLQGKRCSGSPERDCCCLSLVAPIIDWAAL